MPGMTLWLGVPDSRGGVRGKEQEGEDKSC